MERNTTEAKSGTPRTSVGRNGRYEEIEIEGVESNSVVVDYSKTPPELIVYQTATRQRNLANQSSNLAIELPQSGEGMNLNRKPFSLDDYTDTDALLGLNTKRRQRDGEPDLFRYWIRLPESLEGDADYFNTGEYAQITFANGEGGGVGTAAMGDTLPRDTIEGVAGIYLRKAPHETDGSEVASSRLVRDDSLGQPVTLPPKVVTEQGGLGIDGDAYNSKDITLLFEPILREDGVLLTPVGYDDGSTYELPELPATATPIREIATDPNAAINILEGKYAGLVAENLPKNVVALSQRVRSGGTSCDPSYGYTFHLREALSDMDTAIEAGGSVTVIFDNGRDDPPASYNDRSHYDDGFDPAIVLGKINEDDNSSVVPDRRKLQSKKSGTKVSIPSKFVSGIESLHLDENNYNSEENPLLFEVISGPHAIMLDPIGYQDGTPYPIPKPQLATEAAVSVY